jgi:hypothetical protein
LRRPSQGIEPPIDVLLLDPIISLRAQADGLSLADVERVVATAQIKLQGTPQATPVFSSSRPHG